MYRVGLGRRDRNLGGATHNKNSMSTGSRRKKVGLALGSGSARGNAHIGVIRALEAEGIPIDFIAGTSIGALVGAIYAMGDLDTLEAFMRGLDWKRVLSYFDLVFPRAGLLDGERINELVSQYVSAQMLEDARIPFCAIAAELGTGHEVRIRSGSVVDAVRASISLPGILTPFCSDGKYFVDGGLVNPVPVDAVREIGAEFVIAVDLSSDAVAPVWENGNRAVVNSDATAHLTTSESVGMLQVLEDRYRLLGTSVREKINGWLPERRNNPNIFEVIGMSLNIMGQKITLANLQACPPDLLIQPELAHLGMFDFDKADEAITEGFEKTRVAVQHLAL